MRMWMVNPKIMCNKHLLGEHCELHMFVGTLRLGINIEGYIKNNLLEPLSILQRHTELVQEMECRGMNHCSPLEVPAYIIERLSDEIRCYTIKREDALAELIRRCKDCRRNYIRFLVEGRNR